MFRKWLKKNRIEDYDFSAPLFPRGSDREFWGAKSKKSHIENAEKYLNYSWPLIKASDYIAFRTEGDRMRQETPSFARRGALTNLLLGELCEYKGRFIPDIVDGLFLICEETFWGISAHYPISGETDKLPDAKECYIDLFAGETAAALSLCYYLLYDELYDYCPEILPRIEYEMKRRILDPYLAHTDFWWMGYNRAVNNWNPWIISNVLTAFLLMEQSSARKYKALRKMMYEINNIYTAYPEDGGCDEGPNYWTVSGGTLFEFIYQLYAASGEKLNFLTDEKIQKIMQYEYFTYIADGRYVNFADGNPIVPANTAALLYQYGKTVNDAKMCELAKRLYKDYHADSLDAKKRSSYVKRELHMLIFADELSESDCMTASDSYIYPHMQAAYMRQDKWFCAVKGGHNGERHNHNDVGSFLLYDGAVPVLLDPGCGTYTANTFNEHRYEIWTMQSAWHNLPDINGISQHDGSDFCADFFDMQNGVISVSFQNAYPLCGLKECTRKLWFEGGALHICDKFAFEKGENTVSEHFMTKSEPKIYANKVVFGDYVLECGENDGISYDVMPFDGDKKLINAWQTDRLFRITVTYHATRELENKIIVRKS